MSPGARLGALQQVLPLAPQLLQFLAVLQLLLQHGRHVLMAPLQLAQRHHAALAGLERCLRPLGVPSRLQHLLQRGLPLAHLVVHVAGVLVPRLR